MLRWMSVEEYELPDTYADLVAAHHDHLLLATVMLAMARGEPLHVEGTLSPSLVANLRRFQDQWATWRPRTYHRVEITADDDSADFQRPQDKLIKHMIKKLDLRTNLAGGDPNND